MKISISGSGEFKKEGELPEKRNKAFWIMQAATIHSPA
jgi:hypothetical protein